MHTSCATEQRGAARTSLWTYIAVTSHLFLVAFERFGIGFSEKLGVGVQDGLVGQAGDLVLREANEESQLASVQLRYPFFGRLQQHRFAPQLHIHAFVRPNSA